jgi:thiosulfate/3-mercaptopyruvate sulfurtransferase
MHRHLYRLFALFGLLILASAGLARAAAPEFLADAEWLEGKLNDPKLVVLEVRYHPHRYGTVGHIAGAVQVQRFKDLGDNDAPVLMRLPARQSFEATLRRWGINNDSTIVIYDDSRSALASRLYFLLALYGYDMQRVRILDGGTVGWTAFNELSQTPTPPRAAGKVTLKTAEPSLVAEWTDVYDEFVARRHPDTVLIDARPREMYTGELIRHSVQGGHIPGAINIVSLDGTDGQTQKWRSLDELAALYKDVPKNARVVLYCHDGFRMTLAWMQLKALGYQNVLVMNGGWAQWDKSLTLPVVSGKAPFDADFSL